MQILFNIPDKYVSLDKSFQEMILEMEADGVRGIATILPKGHGRLIDADALRKEISSWGMNDYEPSDFIDEVDIADTIIEADVPKRRKSTPLEENDNGYNCENWIP